MSRRSNVLAIAAALLVACSGAWPTYDPPPTAERVEPRPVFAFLHRSMERCLGVTRLFEAIEWYVVPGTRSILDPWEGKPRGAYYLSPTAIVLSENTYRFGPPLVAHEIGHYLVDDKTGWTHDRPRFFECETEAWLAAEKRGDDPK